MGKSLPFQSARKPPWLLMELWLINVDQNRIRNYIGKEWFLEMTLQAEPTPLANQISSILKKPSGSNKDETGRGLPNGNGHLSGV